MKTRLITDGDKFGVLRHGKKVVPIACTSPQGAIDEFAYYAPINGLTKEEIKREVGQLQKQIP